METSIDTILDELIPSDKIWEQRHSIDAFSSICNQIIAVRNKNGQILQAIYRGYPEAENISQRIKRKYLDFHEKFYNEILPLHVLLTKKFNADTDILVKYTGNTNAPYDAEIFKISDDSYIQKVEFTSVIDGKSVSVFKEHTKEFGYSPGVPGIPGSIKPYKKDVGLQKQNVQAGYAAQSDEVLCQFIQNAILKKKKEKYTGFWLAVTFIDWQSAFDFDPLYGTPTQRYKSLFQNIVHQLNPDISEIFTKIFFIGSSCGYFDEIDSRECN